jgi:hypothetical protein
MNDLPAAKIKMMKASAHCLLYGMLSLVPAIGLPFGLVALWVSGRVRLQEKQLWNPAKPYRMIGVACAAVGTVLWSALLLFIFGNLLIYVFGG